MREKILWQPGFQVSRYYPTLAKLLTGGEKTPTKVVKWDIQWGQRGIQNGYIPFSAIHLSIMFSLDQMT